MDGDILKCSAQVSLLYTVTQCDCIVGVPTLEGMPWVKVWLLWEIKERQEGWPSQQYPLTENQQYQEINGCN